MVGAAMMVAAGGACGGDAPPESGATPGADVSAEPEAVVLSRVRVAGSLLVGENTQEFQPCAGGPAYWLDGPLTPDVLELHAELVPGVEPFESIFLDVVADLGPPPAVGPGTSYEGSILVQRLRRAAFEGWGCDDMTADLVVEASGTEPFWQLRITETEAVFQTPDTRVVLDMGELQSDFEGFIVQGTDPELGNVFLYLTEMVCRNAMSGALTHLGARLERGGRTLEGCGFLGPVGDPDAL
jgi:putative lipoprotein